MVLKTVPFQGCFRRLIDMRSWDSETVVIWLEDDFHHFGLTVVHDGTMVRDVRSVSLRTPWTSCRSAVEPLRALIGQPLVARPSDVGRLIEMRLQCTHLFDLAGLALAHALDGREHRRYHATVEKVGAPDEYRRRAVLRQDEAPVMTWELTGASDIVGPAPYAGHSTDRGFREWSESMELREAERAFVLRRAVFVSGGRTIVYDGSLTAADVEVAAVCHAYQPTQRPLGIRYGTHIVPHDAGPEGMLSQVNTKP
ncbi:hypothetical protein AZL_b02180 (plasmid) [Azospirillum sp. B510]|uniref:DUF2889 domain-containing protein n=1 Tax=Azospirillum sp. (strain B510) TaxID=137722 RepID=UPI0001C4CC1B|nr:DUF2889 domain-containing protein [Azospirillum sp. B510]BAI74881.1 hypothetical protein AZL_b02180 [Azospirillum sp. B510]